MVRIGVRVRVRVRVRVGVRFRVRVGVGVRVRGGSDRVWGCGWCKSAWGCSVRRDRQGRARFAARVRCGGPEGEASLAEPRGGPHGEVRRRECAVPGVCARGGG